MSGSFRRAHIDRCECILADNENRIYVSEGIASDVKTNGLKAVIFTK